jgi:Cyclin
MDTELLPHKGSLSHSDMQSATLAEHAVNQEHAILKKKTRKKRETNEEDLGIRDLHPMVSSEPYFRLDKDGLHLDYISSGNSYFNEALSCPDMMHQTMDLSASLQPANFPHYRRFSVSFIIKLVAKAFNAFMEPLTSASKTACVPNCADFILPFNTLVLPTFVMPDSTDLNGSCVVMESSTCPEIVYPLSTFTPLTLQLKGIEEGLSPCDNALYAMIHAFESPVMPAPISVEDYLLRIHKYTSMMTESTTQSSSPSTSTKSEEEGDGSEQALFLMLLVLADRLQRLTLQAFRISLSTIHRFIIASVTFLCKLTRDTFFTNSYYAKVGGISAVELNCLEIYLLGLLKWQIIMDDTLLVKTFRHLLLTFS